MNRRSSIGKPLHANVNCYTFGGDGVIRAGEQENDSQAAGLIADD